MYFEDFPSFLYDFELTPGNRTTYSITDITRNIRFRRDILANITVYDTYDVLDGETPEIVADKIYGDANLHWVLMLANERFDYRSDWVMTAPTLEQYVIRKYGNDHIYDIHHYETTNGLIVSSDYPSAVAITNMEYEDAVNESKRTIKIIAPELLNIVLKNFKEMM